ncbi:unnamed protein product [Caenorhabditis angaria]|uniref:Uncharacterized protein n=1 Tax=Caenorhabditis angaria TaxID=860376 RepID=A0A9P1I3H4_9PELO|nr:unnamed protein product [Caenorhabditis angaria]
MACLSHDDQIGEDDKKCYPYFQIESGKSKEIELKKGKFMKKKLGKEDDPTAVGKILPITLFHMNSWTGTKSGKEPFEMTQNVGLLCKEIFKMEVAVSFGNVFLIANLK